MERIKLGDICEILNGFAFKSENYAESGIRIIRITNVQNGFVEDNNPVFYPFESMVLNKYMLEEGDLLMSLTGNVGRVAILEKQFLPAALNQRVACLRLKTDKLSKQYLFHILNNSLFEQQCIQSSKGVAQKNMSTEWLKDYEIPLYSRDKQDEIASILDRIHSIFCLGSQELRMLDELVRIRLIEMFGAYSAKDCKRRIGDYADVLGGYAFKSDLFCRDAIPVIRISNIKDGEVILDYSTCYSKDFWEQNKRFRAEQMDIMMAMSGATTGKVGLYTSTQPALINQRVACIRALPNKACPEFLFVAMQIKWMYDLIQETSTGCAQPNISGKQIEDMPVPNASFENQRHFARIVQQVNKSKMLIQQQLAELETLKKSLMQEYFG